MTRLALAVFIAVAASGCKMDDSDYGVVVNHGLNSTEIRMVVLKDGTRCAVLVSNSGESRLDCDWSKP